MNEDRLRDNVKTIIREIGLVLLYAILSVIAAFLFNAIFFAINLPPTISDENQRDFTEKCYTRMKDNNPVCAFGDLKLYYLGEYKYDYKISSMSELNDINEARQRILTFTAKDYSHYVGWGCLIALLLIRYLSKFSKWLYPKNQENESQE